MARPKSFDRETALAAAVHRFHAHGYFGTTADDLLREMGIARQSFYDTFGNKRDLYIEALRAYSARNVSELIEILRDHSSPMEALRTVLMAPAHLSRAKRQMGCFGINSICEFGVSDPEVAAAGASSASALDAALEALIEEARNRGEIRQALSAKSASNYVRCVLAGLKVAARAGAPVEAMEEIAEIALSALGHDAKEA